MAKTLRILLMLLPLLAVTGCKGSPSVAEVEKLIQQNLKPGDPAAKIETFFKQNNLAYDFDRFNQLYESGIRSTGWIGIESVIRIEIYVNPDRSFKRAEVQKAYTWF